MMRVSMLSDAARGRRPASWRAGETSVSTLMPKMKRTTTAEAAAACRQAPLDSVDAIFDMGNTELSEEEAGGTERRPRD